MKPEVDGDFVLDVTQTDAVIRALSNGVSVIIGEPGTGKTTTIKRIKDVASEVFPVMQQVFWHQPVVLHEEWRNLSENRQKPFIICWV